QSQPRDHGETFTNQLRDLRAARLQQRARNDAAPSAAWVLREAAFQGFRIESGKRLETYTEVTPMCRNRHATAVYMDHVLPPHAPLRLHGPRRLPPEYASRPYTRHRARGAACR